MGYSLCSVYKNMKKFASKDMSRPMMNYIYFNGEYAIATSPYALARLKCEVVYTIHLWSHRFLEMGKVFKIAANSIPESNKTVYINK